MWSRIGNGILSFLSWTPIVWIALSYFFYLIDFDPRIIANESMHSLLMYWFLRYFVWIGVPLWFTLIIYKGLAKHFSGKQVLFHVLLFAIGFALLFLMMELNPNGWVNSYFD